MGYIKDTAHGLTWMGILRVSTRVIAFVKIGILARLLQPAQYGLFGIAGLILSFLEMLTETGINVFFIQREGEIKDYINTAWVVSILRGISIALLVIIFTPFIASFFRTPEAKPLLWAISLVPLIRGFINPAIITYRKELQFQKEFLFRFVVFLFDGVVAVVITLITHSPISLVWGMVAGALIEVSLSFILITPRPRLEWNRQKLDKIVGRGKWMTAASTFNYAFYNADDVIVGRLLDAASLGLYQMMYKISTLPITEVSDVFGNVTFPVYSKISTDPKRVKDAFLKVTGSITLLTLGMGLLLILFPRQIIYVLLGDQWLHGAPILQILSIFGVLKAISNSSSSLLLAIKKQEYVMIITLVSILGLVITIVPLINRFGLTGAALSTIIGTIVALPFIFYYLHKVFGKTNG